mmetsp:Transcript_23668/g.35982  ORF Transcript_23668/g.35982 Transcript_23668/m.35982 type:complete len:710 (+) Transcript_23668:68-2197(+)
MTNLMNRSMFNSMLKLRQLSAAKGRATNGISRASSTSSSAHQKVSDNANTGIKLSTVAGIAGLSLTAGYAAGNFNNLTSTTSKDSRELPSGLPRGCCSCDSPPVELNLTKSQEDLPSNLASLIGEENVISGLTEDSSNTMYLKGARLGRGKALAIVTPISLQDAVKALEVAVQADCIVIPQGQNTGLTGGSVPREEEDKRPAVIISMRKLNMMFPIDNGEKVVCLAGAGIATLANNLNKWGFPDRESHSTLGSTFLDPTTAAGVAFGSGGTQLRKGPAYTDRALYAKVKQDKWGRHVIELVNTLGIEGIEDTDFHENKGSSIEQLDIYANDIKQGYDRPMASSSDSQHGKAMASDRSYPDNVCECGNDKKGSAVSRCNADTKGELCNRSEGKVLILATVHDTFQRAAEKGSYWVACKDFETTLRFRKEVCLDNAKDLPISMEYMDRDTFDIVDRSGRILANLIKVIGMGSMMGSLWNIKLKIEAMPFDGAELICDKLLHTFNVMCPAILPKKFMKVGKSMDHHVAMTVGEFGEGEKARLLLRMKKFVAENEGKIEIVECDGSSDEMSLTAFRFVAAPAFRTWCVGEDVQGFSVDYALPKNAGEAPPLLGKVGEIDQPVPLKRMRYSHFGCNVVHEDLAYALGVDTHAAKLALKKEVEKDCGGKLPAEHGHGTEYSAPKETQKRWMNMDPLNIMNPGIGGLSSKYKYSSK